VIVNYPTRIEEREIMDRMAGEALASPNPVIKSSDIQRARKAANNVYVDERIKNYILDLIFATRDPGANGLKNLDAMIEFGASPRATIFLIRATKAFAFLRGRGYVTPDDVKSVAPDILRHRLVVSFEAEAENITSENIVDQLLRRIPVP
jgi:MoxR-like ATPase